MAGSSDLETQLEEAMAAYAATLTVTANLYTGEDNADKAPPAAIFQAEGGPELEANTGIYNLTGRVTVRSTAAIDTDEVSPKAAHDELVATLFDAFELKNLGPMLNYYASGLIISGTVLGPRQRGDSGDCWENYLEFTAPCSRA